jgi:hypothetical protein
MHEEMEAGCKAEVRSKRRQLEALLRMPPWHVCTRLPDGMGQQSVAAVQSCFKFAGPAFLPNIKQ